jgi:hypothetical protein
VRQTRNARTATFSMASTMAVNPFIVGAEQLRTISGKRTASAVRRWANTQGIHVRDGKDGPWTTVQAINTALGIASTYDNKYRPEDVI